MTVYVNGEPQVLAPGVTVAQVVAQVVSGEPKGVAVALNSEVVARSAWATTTVAAEDRLEVLNAIGGG